MQHTDNKNDSDDLPPCLKSIYKNVAQLVSVHAHTYSCVSVMTEWQELHYNVDVASSLNLCSLSSSSFSVTWTLYERLA